jgi:hypothetical protein
MKSRAATVRGEVLGYLATVEDSTVHEAAAAMGHENVWTIQPRFSELAHMDPPLIDGPARSASM